MRLEKCLKFFAKSTALFYDCFRNVYKASIRAWKLNSQVAIFQTETFFHSIRLIRLGSSIYYRNNPQKVVDKRGQLLPESASRHSYARLMCMTRPTLSALYKAYVYDSPTLTALNIWSAKLMPHYLSERQKNFIFPYVTYLLFVFERF